MIRLVVRLFVTLMAIFFATFPVPVSGQTTTYVGPYKSVQVERVVTYNPGSGAYDRYVKAFPNDGKSSHPVVLFNAPYAVRIVDSAWVARVGAVGMYADVNLPQSRRLYPCDGDCQIFAMPAVAENDLSRLGNVAGEIPGNTLLDRLFDEGYGVAVLLNGHYLGNDALSMMFGVQQALITLSDDSRVEKVVIVGMSQGGQLAIHPLTFPSGVPGAIPSDDPRLLRILAGAVSLAGWMEPAKMWEFMKKNPWFYNSYKNRWAASFGMDPANWSGITYESLASRFHTPLLMIHGTDDCMVPVNQATEFFSAIKARGGSANVWVYENGPCNESVPITTSAHGVLDQGLNPATGGRWGIGKMTLIQNFIRDKMPLDHDVSSDGNTLPGMLDELAGKYFMSATQAERQNVLDIIAQAGNPRIQYVSSDPLLSGAGDKVVPALKDQVFKAWQSRITIVRVPEDYDMKYVFYGYAARWFMSDVTPAEQAHIVASVATRANPHIIYVSEDPLFSGRGNEVVWRISDKVVWDIVWWFILH